MIEPPKKLDETSVAGSAEVEFALVISRVIESLREDPEQLRSTVYELARVKLRSDALQRGPRESARLLQALETAIQGVEQFARHRDTVRMVDFSAAGPSGQSGPGTQPPALAPPAGSHFAANRRPLPAHGIDDAPWDQPGKHARRSLLAPLLRFGLAALVVVGILGAVVANQRGWLSSFKRIANVQKPDAAVTAPPAPVSSPELPKPAPQLEGGVPLPTVYGIYAIHDKKLDELELLPGQVPDKRVAVSTAINTPSKTVIAAGHPEFVVYRRDLALSVPERAEVRVVAKVKRAMTFEPGKTGINALADTWVIRNISNDFRIAPVPGNSEMLLVRPENDDLTLAPGRYVLVLKKQGYDFTVEGAVTDASQCLERVELNGGAFYTECKNP